MWTATQADVIVLKANYSDNPKATRDSERTSQKAISGIDLMPFFSARWLLVPCFSRKARIERVTMQACSEAPSW